MATQGIAQSAGRPSLRGLLEQLLEAETIELPPTPEVALRVLAEAGKPLATPASLVEIVQRDAGLVAAILRSANSATHRRGAEIVSVPQAVARVGLSAVSEIALSTSIQARLLCAPRYRHGIRRTWRRSLAAGLFAKEISRELRRNVELAYVCGLMRCAGTAMVLYALASHPRSEKVGEPDALEVAAELRGPFAAAATRRWGLPPRVIDAVDDRGGEEPRSEEASIAAMAEQLASYAISGSRQPPKVEREAEALDLYPEDVAKLVARSSRILDEVNAG